MNKTSIGALALGLTTLAGGLAASTAAEAAATLEIVGPTSVRPGQLVTIAGRCDSESGASTEVARVSIYDGRGNYADVLTPTYDDASFRVGIVVPHTSAAVAENWRTQVSCVYIDGTSQHAFGPYFFVAARGGRL